MTVRQLGITLLLAAIATATQAKTTTADANYYGETIVTVNDHQPRSEAIAVRNGASS